MGVAFQIGALSIDLGERRVRGPNGDVELTPLEAELLGFLRARRGHVVSREELLSAVWGYSPRSVSRAVDHTVYRLRKKIEVDPSEPHWIVSSRAGGYRLEPEPAEEPALPEEPSTWVGRRRELRDVAAALERDHIVQIVGIGGIGKTRLALRAARAWEGEAYFVRAGAAPHGAAVLGQVGRALGVPGGRVLDALAERHELLLVLDEVEHLADEDLDWLDGLNDVAVLLTSRRPLPRGTPIELGPLKATEAALLVIARATVPLEGSEAAALVEAVDGIPLALELVTSWLAAVSADEVVARLRSRQAPVLASALEGSWEILDGPGRHVLGEAALFAGDFTLPDLEAISTETSVLPAVAQLVARGWIQRVADGLRIPSVVRRFLVQRDRLAPDGTGRHARWLMSWAPEARLSLRRHWDRDTHHRLLAAEDELRLAAQHTTDPNVAVPLLLTLHRSLGDGSIPLPAAIAEVQRVAGLLGDRSAWAADVHLLWAVLLVAVPDPVAAQHQLDVATSALSTTNRQPAAGLLASIEGMRSSILMESGPFDQSLELGRRAVAGMLSVGDRLGAGIFRTNLAILVGRDDPEAGITLALQALDDLAQVGEPVSLGRAHGTLATLHRRLDSRSEAADDHHERARALFADAGHRAAQGQLLSIRAAHLLDLGHPQEAKEAATEARRLFREVGLRRSAAVAALNQAAAHLMEGEAATALDTALEARATLVACGANDARRIADQHLGFAKLCLGRPEEAAADFASGIAVSHRTGHPVEWLALGALMADTARGHAHAPLRTDGLGAPQRAIMAFLEHGGPVPEPVDDADFRIALRAALRLSGA